MACSKYTLTNTGSSIVNFSYQRCDDAMWEYQVELNPNQNKNILDDDIIDVCVNRYKFAQPICVPNFLSKLPPVSVFTNLWIADTSYYYPEDRGISESIGFGFKLADLAII